MAPVILQSEIVEREWSASPAAILPVNMRVVSCQRRSDILGEEDIFLPWQETEP
jgi:hypothetical protein